MKFLPSDNDWGGMSKDPARQKRYLEVLDGIAEVALEVLQEHNRGLTMIAQVPQGILATGVKGDARMYAPIVALYANRLPDYDHLAVLAKEITDRAPVSHVIFCTTKQLPTDLEEAVRYLGAAPGVIEERRV